MPPGRAWQAPRLIWPRVPISLKRVRPSRHRKEGASMRASPVALFLCVLAAIAPAAAAVDGRPLPPFRVISPAGVGVDGSALSNKARWLLIYVSPECQPCDRLLTALNSWQLSPQGQRIVII